MSDLSSLLVLVIKDYGASPLGITHLTELYGLVNTFLGFCSTFIILENKEINLRNILERKDFTSPCSFLFKTKYLTGRAQFIINRQPLLSLRTCTDCPRNHRTLNDSMTVSFVDAIRRQMFKELENSTKRTKCYFHPKTIKVGKAYTSKNYSILNG